MRNLKRNLKNVMDRINQATIASGRDPESVRLVAVSKTIPAETVKRAIDAGANILGENYIQEAKSKFDDLISYPVSWHFIGHLQTNKAKYAVRIFDLIHSVDSFKLALELNKHAGKTGKIQHILIQVNVAGESSKSGISTQDTLNLIQDISVLKNLAIKGLMTMPPFFNEPEKVRPFFKDLRNLRDTIRSERIDNVDMEELSMGMTGDFEAAIEEGATLVRIGTAIFGERN
ncbi:MAG: YggS family pyridoxal phosphate-dependent enzyme [Deltaproteobacteria bacterium]|nr:YggS family pyridoxal phosphate-dependent enzyme [Deltaproteobacteria bacterium]